MGKRTCRAASCAAWALLLVSGAARPCFGETNFGKTNYRETNYRETNYRETKFRETNSRSKKLWAVSAVALVVANVLDARSSMGRYEANPLLRNSQGQFSPGRAVMIKSAVSGGALLLQVLMQRKMPAAGLEKPAAITNLAAAAALAATAHKNTHTPPAAP